MTLNRLALHLVERGIELTVIHPKARNTFHWARHGEWKTVQVKGLPIPGYPEAQVGMPSGRLCSRLWRQSPPDLVHVATEGVLGWSAAETARKLKIPLITSFHTNFHEYAKHYHAAWMKPLVLRYLKSLHGRARITLVPDFDLISALEQFGFSGCQYWARGVDTRLFHPKKRSFRLRNSWGASPETPVFLHVSRVAAEKNIPFILDGFRAFCDRSGQEAGRMVVVGDGPARKRLERAYPEVHFSGMKFNEELAACYASADLFVFGSRTETFGNVVLEAMASGCPVLSFDYAAGRQMIRDGESGVLVPLDSPGEFIRKWLEHGADLLGLRTMGKAARVRAEQEPWEGIIDGYLEVVSDVLGKAGTG